MSEELTEEEKAKKKTDSRKFVVWITWVVIAVAILIVGAIVMIASRSFPTEVIELVKLVLEYLFYISLVYLGVNGITKVGFAISDAISGKEDK